MQTPIADLSRACLANPGGPVGLRSGAGPAIHTQRHGRARVPVGTRGLGGPRNKFQNIWCRGRVGCLQQHISICIIHPRGYLSWVAACHAFRVIAARRGHDAVGARLALDSSASCCGPRHFQPGKVLTGVVAGAGRGELGSDPLHQLTEICGIDPGKGSDPGSSFRRVPPSAGQSLRRRGGWSGSRGWLKPARSLWRWRPSRRP